ncbi:hypothetical protein DACRYDRAFT_53318 [Dacryopinax primogenitus]|uniref:Uncharacterized protein n=1 Tax=Dacryopinax primogenitus (strain DJM 731) TaxID=1858805 RepID=M5FTI0_DACPD|nr:uncharacterized protein DACRYDRAFT_53318 [Dacryopinax primogenitus]EJU00951.1 hypothetical protein DACRYDRAFT_53318 [Dacryopinax primogenitus]
MADQFKADHEHILANYNFKPGTLVLICNTHIEKELNHKSKPQFFGPMVVVTHTARGSYVIANLDGAVLKACITQFRIYLYHQ